MASTRSRYETQFPHLFAQLPPVRPRSVAAALGDLRLEDVTITRELVALMVRSITENLTDEHYLAAVLEVTSAIPAHI